MINQSRRRRGPDPALLREMEAVFRRRGVEVRMELSRSVEHCRSLFDEAEKGRYDSLWIGGGDGTVNHTLNATVGRFDSYAVVPMGTVNGMARALGTPADPVEAVEWLLDGEPTALDLGRVGGRLFGLSATVGFHAAIFHSTNDRLKRTVGRAAFFAAGAYEACRARELPRFEVEILKSGSIEETCRLPEPSAGDGPGADSCAPPPMATERIDRAELERERSAGYSLVISNFCNFAGFGAVREGDLCDSSFLQAHLFPSCDLWPMLRFFGAMRFRRPREDDAGVEHYRAAELRVRSAAPLRLQVDGEPVHLGDDREYRFVCVPKAVRVLWNRPAVEAEAAARESAGGVFQ